MAQAEAHLLLVVGGQVRQFRVVIFVKGWLTRLPLLSLVDALEVELVGVALAVHFGHDVLVVVVAQRPAQLVIVHVGLTLAFAPSPRHLVGIRHLELTVGPLPGDAAGVVAVRQQLQEKLPELDLTAPCQRQNSSFLASAPACSRDDPGARFNPSSDGQERDLGVLVGNS